MNSLLSVKMSGYFKSMARLVQMGLLRTVWYVLYLAFSSLYFLLQKESISMPSFAIHLSNKIL